MNADNPVNVPPQQDTPMDEFEIKPVQSSPIPPAIGKKNKVSLVKLAAIGGGVLILLCVLGIVLLQLTRSQITTNTQPTVAPEPTLGLRTSTPQATQETNLPEEWKALETDLTRIQNEASKPDDNRSKLSIPNINFETGLVE